MEKTHQKLFNEINSLHEDNVVNAQRTAENAIIIGIKLHQVKELLPHGEFQDTATKRTKLTDRTCRNYMRLAEERLIEHRALALMDAKSHGGKTETVSVLPAELQAIPADIREQARGFVESEEFKWTSLDIKPKDLVRGIGGKEIGELYRFYGVIRDKKPAQHHPRKSLNPDEELTALKEQARSLMAQYITCCNLLPNVWEHFSNDERSQVEDARLGLGQFIKANSKKKS